MRVNVCKCSDCQGLDCRTFSEESVRFRTTKRVCLLDLEHLYQVYMHSNANLVDS